MRESDYQPGFPGTLVRADFREGAGADARTIEGLAFVPAPLPPPLDRERVIGRVYEWVARAHTALLRLEGMVAALPEPNVLLSAMRLREAQESSRIEDTVASLDEIAMAEAHAGVRREAVEVQRNRMAIEAGLASRLPMSGRLVRDMHRVLVGPENRGARPGKFRDRQVYIGDEARGFAGARFVPPPPGEHLERCIGEWEVFVNPGTLRAGVRERWPVPIEWALAHYQFEAIHPFSDGNGRLGRALVNLGPVKSGFLRHPVCNLSEWIASRREEYCDRLLRVSTRGEWEEWMVFFCRAVGEQAEMDSERARRVQKLREGYQVVVMRRRNSALLVRLVDSLFERQVVSIPEVAKRLGVSYTSAQQHVEFLERERILRRVPGMSYGKLFVAQGVLHAIYRGKGEA